MNDLLVMHVGDALEDLLHETDAGLLRQDELVLYDPVEELAAADAAEKKRNSVVSGTGKKSVYLGKGRDRSSNSLSSI